MGFRKGRTELQGKENDLRRMEIKKWRQKIIYRPVFHKEVQGFYKTVHYRKQLFLSFLGVG